MRDRSAHPVVPRARARHAAQRTAGAVTTTVNTRTGAEGAGTARASIRCSRSVASPGAIARKRHSYRPPEPTTGRGGGSSSRPAATVSSPAPAVEASIRQCVPVLGFEYGRSTRSSPTCTCCAAPASPAPSSTVCAAAQAPPIHNAASPMPAADPRVLMIRPRSPPWPHQPRRPARGGPRAATGRRARAQRRCRPSPDAPGCSASARANAPTAATRSPRGLAAPGRPAAWIGAMASARCGADVGRR